MPKPPRQPDSEDDDTPARRRPLDDDEDEDDDVVPIRRHSKKRGFWTRPVVIVLASILGAGAIAVGIVGVARSQRAAAQREAIANRKPQADVEGVQWDCHQLVAFLNAKGLEVDGGPDDIAKIGEMAGNADGPNERRRQMADRQHLVSPKYGGLVTCFKLGIPMVYMAMEGEHPTTYQMDWGGFWFTATDLRGSESLLRAIHAELAGSHLIRGPLRRR